MASGEGLPRPDVEKEAKLVQQILEICGLKVCPPIAITFHEIIRALPTVLGSWFLSIFRLAPLLRC